MYFRLALQIGLILMLAGCLHWGRQTVVITMAPDRDEIHALVVYEGLEVGSSNVDRYLESAKEKLKDLFDSKDVFCVGGTGDACFPIGQAPAKDDPLSVLNRRHVSIINAAMFLDPYGRLCGWQHIRIHDASKYVDTANEALSKFISEEVAVELQRRLDPDRVNTGEKIDALTLLLLQRAARDRQQWIHVEPGRIRLTLVGSPEFRDTIMQGLMEMPREESVPTAWSFERRHGHLIASLGQGDGRPIYVSFGKRSKVPGNGEEELQAYARSLAVLFRENRTATESIVAEFLAQRVR